LLNRVAASGLVVNQLQIRVRDQQSLFAFGPKVNISFQRFFQAVSICAQQLPDGRYAINTCEDRYSFSVAFYAALLRGQTNILLPGVAAKAIESAQATYPDSYLLTDAMAMLGDTDGESVANNDDCLERLNNLDPGHLAARVFTSGTTGLSKPLDKTWHSLLTGARINTSYILRVVESGAQIIATVPPWHMYGLEWSVLLPLVSNFACYSKTILFPDDIRTALSQADGPRLLLSTPLHLRALLDSQLELPDIDTVVCATSRLSEQLAQRMESAWGCRIFEIYGCTELGSMACRLPAEESRWQFFAEMAVDRQGEQITVSAAHVDAPAVLADQLQFDDDGKFAILGRIEDMVKVAGKRGSLADITQCLLSITGVDDGVIFDPEQLGLGDSDRLGAVVVAQQLTAAEIRLALRPLIDRAFLPRPIHIVDAIPRNVTGKLLRQDLQALLMRLKAGKVQNGD
jgi:acyl-coenzyme A synthetase/AMP-(fatty) acid ligase